MSHDIEREFHALLVEKFKEAKWLMTTGDFKIEVTASGSLNSKECKVETEVSIGDWSSQGRMTARTIATAFPIAMSRCSENRAHKVKLLSVMGDDT